MAELGLRFRRLARLRQQVGEVVVAVGQAASEVGDGGVVVGQLLQRARAPCGARSPPPTACPSPTARCRGWCGLSARPLRNSVTAGLSSASFCKSASALRYSASASDGLPVSHSRMPRLLWLLARSARNSVTAGLSSASFCRSASALRCSASASDCLPVSSSRAPLRLIVSARSCRASFGRRPGGVGQRLLVRTRQAVDATGPRRTGPCCIEQPSETPPAVSQGSPRGGVAGDRPGQVRQQGLRLAVGCLGLLGLAGVDRSQPPTAVRLRPTSALVSASAPGLGRQRLAGGEDLPVSGQRVLRAADLVGQVGQLEVGLRQRPTRGQVRLLAQQGAELAVEVGWPTSAAGCAGP